jgi:hypothetical protein
MFFDGRFVTLSFVFIHIPGGSFIFNISWGYYLIPGLEKRLGELPHLVEVQSF